MKSRIFLNTRILDYALLLLAAILCYWAVFFDGYPIGDDYKNQIIAFEAFREQVSQGDVYPRWLHDINHGLGGANLFFYPPLIYYVEYAISSILPDGTPTLSILSYSAFFFLILSGISCYSWLLSLSSRRGAVIGAMFYMAAPYHLFIDLYERNNGAEFAAYALIPLIFLFVQNTGGNPFFRVLRLALIYGSFVLTHLPSAVFVTPFAGLWAFLHAYINAKDRTAEDRIDQSLNDGLLFGISAALGCLLVGIYLYPALTMLGMVRSHVLWSGPFYTYTNWFLWPKNACPEPYGGYCSLLFLIAGTVLFVPLIGFAMVFDRINEKKRQYGLALSLMGALCFFLMVPASSAIWQILTPLQKVQFPYRLMMISDLVLSALIGLLFSSALDKPRGKVISTWVGIALIMLAVGMYTARYVQQSWYPDKAFFDYRIEKKILTGEFFPKNEEMTVQIPDFVEKTPEIPLIQVEPKEIEATLIRHVPRLYEIDVSAPSPGMLTLRQFHFPGWGAHIVEPGKDVPLKIKAVEPYGQVSIEIPKGNYRLDVILMPMKQEIIGGFMSVCGVLIFFLLFVAGIFWRKKPE